MQALREILSSLDVPELEPVPRDHVLTKTFYLLRDFPGRFNTGQTWVEALPREDDDETAQKPARGGDGVSPIIITSNDLAGAWALRPDGQPMLPLTPGRAAPARVRLPRRRQHRDVHADRQLQGRPGPRAGAARTAGAGWLNELEAPPVIAGGEAPGACALRTGLTSSLRSPE